MTGTFRIEQNGEAWFVGIVLAENDYAVKNIYQFKKGKMIPTSNDRQFDEIASIFKSQYHDEIVRSLYGKT